MSDYEFLRQQASSWQNMLPASSYSRQAPNLFNFVSDDYGLKSWFLKNVTMDHQYYPPQDLYTFKDVYIHDISQLFNNEKLLIKGTDRDQIGYSSLDEIWDGTESEYISGVCAFIFKSGKDNYGHLIIEMLPKLEFLDSISNDKITIIVPTIGNDLVNIIRNINRDIYNEKFIIKQMSTPVVKCEELIYPGPITRHNNQKSHVVNSFMEKLINKYKQGFNVSNLYVSRKNFHNRKWINEIEAEELFSKKGFKILYPEKVSFKDQVAIFSSAINVAGAMGAGLSNICFSPEKAEIIMIDNGMYDFFFYDLSCLRQQVFTWIFTQKLSVDNVTKLHEDWHADISLISSALSM